MMYKIYCFLFKNSPFNFMPKMACWRRISKALVTNTIFKMMMKYNNKKGL